MNNHAESTLSNPYREYVFSYERSIKLPWGRVVSGTRRHINGPSLTHFVFNACYFVLKTIPIRARLSTSN